ncbi:hypothetical protein BaRGS_00038782 [Batillaria attramentaria]|uniref:Large ribosomal subunit protein mL37 n=1 Tax=Batillaria attramentaria TaxID=370345 RepID=A0ABD0J596_9CAEN
MKLTQALCKRSMPYEWKKLMDRRLNFPDYPARIPQILVDKGVKVVDPTEKPPQERWYPPVDDPRFYKHPKPEEYVNYNEDPAYVCTTSTCIHEGMRQVARLAKTQVIQGLPSSVDRLIGTVKIPQQNLLLQRYIMQAQRWNTTKERLPKRIDPRKPGWKFGVQYGIPAKLQAGILIRNMLRLYKPVVVRGMSEWLITSNKALPRFADEETVDTTVNYTLPDLFPIAPTIDLHVDHNYTLDHNTGLKSGISHGHPHTIFITDVNHWNHDQRMARSLLFSLGYAIAQAHRQYGNVTKLPEPVCTQCVSLDHQTLNFVFLQLNTLAFDNDNGIKNIAWVDGGNHLFQKILSQPWMPKAIRDERLEDFDPAVFEKLLAVYLNGVPELMSDAV